MLHIKANYPVQTNVAIPLKGKVLFNDAFVAEKVTPFLDGLCNPPASNAKPDKPFLY